MERLGITDGEPISEKEGCDLVKILYRKKTAPFEKDLRFIKIENTPNLTVTVFANTLLKDARPGARVIIGVENPHENEPKGIVIQILRGKSPEMEERIGRVSAYYPSVFLSRSMLIFCCYHCYYRQTLAYLFLLLLTDCLTSSCFCF